jgi:hypothetical protein
VKEYTVVMYDGTTFHVMADGTAQAAKRCIDSGLVRKNVGPDVVAIFEGAHTNLRTLQRPIKL